MTGRYITDAEKAGQRRRVEAYRERLKEMGIRPRQLLLTDAEHERIRHIVAAWRGDNTELNDQGREAAKKLRP